MDCYNAIHSDWETNFIKKVSLPKDFNGETEPAERLVAPALVSRMIFISFGFNFLWTHGDPRNFYAERQSQKINPGRELLLRPN